MLKWLAFIYCVFLFRLDSAVIHHTKLSLASILYQGKSLPTEALLNLKYITVLPLDRTFLSSDTYR